MLIDTLSNTKWHPMISPVLTFFLLGLTTVAQGENITVFAAASLRDGLEAAVTDYETRTRQKVTVSFAGTSVLARQIAMGAPADIFISANQAWGEWLIENQHMSDLDLQPYLTNELVLIGASDDWSWPETFLNSDGLIAMAQVDAVPAGIYGKQALEQDGIWKEVQSRIIQSDNVRGALWFVQRQEAQFGIVYATDAFSIEMPILHRFSNEANEPIVYPLMQLNENENVTEFVEYLISEQGRGYFTQFGFGTVDID